jgi:hypothetical protein
MGITGYYCAGNSCNLDISDGELCHILFCQRTLSNHLPSIYLLVAFPKNSKYAKMIPQINALGLHVKQR